MNGSIKSAMNVHNVKARPSVYLVGALLLLAPVEAGARAQDIPPLELEHFRLVETVKLDEPDTLLLAGIDQIDISPAGRWLVTDRLGEQVLMFDSTGILQASLDPSLCHPGFEFSPVKARFGSNEFIFIATSGNYWGYRFTSDGQCLGSVDPEFHLPDFLDIDPMGRVYSVYAYPDGMKLKHMSATGAIIEEIPLPRSRFPNAARRFDQGGLIADGKHIY